MKRQTLYLLIGAVVMLSVSLVMNLVVIPLIPQDPEDRLFDTIATFEDEEVIEAIPDGNNFRIVHKKWTAVDNNDNVLGTVYNVIARNGYTYDKDDPYGVIDLLVGIKDDMVYVEINDLNQTSTYIGGIQTYIMDVFDGILWTEVEAAEVRNVGDLEAGATASASTGTVKELILKTVNLHFNVIDEDDPYLSMFDESLGYASSEEDETFTSGSAYVLWKRTALDATGNALGAIYKLEGTGESYDGNQGSIGLYVALSDDGTILGYLLPNDEYGHSRPGVHHSNNTAFLDSIVGETLSELSFGTTEDDFPDIVAGSSNTYTLIITMLEALNGEVTS